MPEQLVAKADPISISKHPVIQAVLHPQPVDDLLPLRPRGHARRVILQRRIKSEPRSPSKLAKTKRRNQFANQTHVDAVLHDHVCAPIARRPGVGAAEPHHLRPVLHTERRTPSELYQPDRRVPQAKLGLRKQNARTRRGVPRTHLGRVIAVESDQQEADAVEQVLVADVVVRARRGHGGQ